MGFQGLDTPPPTHPNQNVYKLYADYFSRVTKNNKENRTTLKCVQIDFYSKQTLYDFVADALSHVIEHNKDN